MKPPNLLGLYAVLQAVKAKFGDDPKLWNRPQVAAWVQEQLQSTSTPQSQQIVPHGDGRDGWWHQ